MKAIFIAILLTVSCAVPAQTTETIYRARGDSTGNYYLAMTPREASKGLLLILPGFGSTPQEVLQETTLPAVARSNGYTVVIPLLINYEQIDSTNLYQKLLVNLVPELIWKYNVPKNRFILGGHSIGGHQALFYAEQAYKVNNDGIIKPQLVFGVDPPLDMKRLWNSFTYNRRINFSEASVKEAEFMMKRFIRQFGGSPVQKPAVYEKILLFTAMLKMAVIFNT
jgi:pimeloyl-ACP methyl ester carboxylesterase